MSGATELQLVAVARRHQLQVLTVRDQTERVLAATWARVMTNPSEDAAARWLAAAQPLLLAAQSTAAGLALAFVGGYIGAATGTPAAPSEFTAADFTEPRGVPAFELLMRPVVTMRWELSKGVPMNAASTAGQVRAAQIGATDPMLAYRAASTAEMNANPKVVGYRRVPDALACKFCLLASTQRYRDGELMPLHPHCGCTVAPIVGSKDPGQVLDKDTLGRLKADGVIDEISRRRRISGAEQVVQNYEAKATHWREQARTTPDQEAETRYAKRADEWTAKAKARAAQLDRDRAELQLIRDGRLTKLTSVHDHGELGPTLYDPAHEFAAA